MTDINTETLSSFAPLPTRILIEFDLIIHGLHKFDYMEGSKGFFASFGTRLELALPLAFLEEMVGIALIVGIVARFAFILFIAEMNGDIIMVKSSTGFVVGGDNELELLVMSFAIMLLMSGPGECVSKKTY